METDSEPPGKEPPQVNPPLIRLFVDGAEESLKRKLQGWMEGILISLDQAPCELTVRVVDANESRSLNYRYRSQDDAANVLSFPCDESDELGVRLLGDVLICREVVLMEAEEQGKSPDAHFAHMAVHGLLHLLGYDHRKDHQAALMESLERELITSLGFPDPYAGEEAGLMKPVGDYAGGACDG